ncbi:hypothetical protein PF005_g25959 [Phytophthora fragariae]|uniref:Uncharacterized protein n=1 Tax=Phytophthora fragariae TaxID=53985 RepID=A0A6A3I2G3_9STRA|nr:hypothetical protein PF003_g2618 [Phytophthora fragariae]KAE8922778.1 hypothetical protein PF009_g26960 [Phytophthora fragariae]KAE8974278.1 hypothetical protein PF011_g24925 [Phytophthora fragariae]KAE9071931.1 hypothetical protein PF007_g26361 [Phytophthora fragariae]KAE9100743.1 hypothetical protein PF006_g22837 [Phytophthora fragariae]
MMASETAALYERILTLVPKNELAISYNEVLREEMSSVNRAMNDVSAVFAKLEEVRDAVTKLSNGSSGGRSESLLEVMDSTMELQSNLKRKLKSVLAEMATSGQADNKRLKTDESVDADKKDSEEDETPMPPPAPTVQVLLRLDDETDHDTKSSMDVAWATNVTKQNYRDVMKKLTRLSVLERNRLIPAVLPALVKALSKISSSDGLSIMKYVILWAYLSAGQEHALKALRSFCDAVLPWTNQVHGGRVTARTRINETLSEVVKRQTVQVDEETEGYIRVLLSYDFYILHVNAMAPKERRQHIAQVISTWGEVMSGATVFKMSLAKITKLLRLVVQWTRLDPRDPELLRLYDHLVADSKAYADKISNIVFRVDLVREINKIEDAIRDLPKAAAQERATTALNWFRQLNTKVLSLEKVDEGILMLDELIRDREPGWKPRKSEAMLECCDILKGYVMLLDEERTRGQRLALIAKWYLLRRKTTPSKV